MYYILAFVSVLDGAFDKTGEYLTEVMSHRGYTEVHFDDFSDNALKRELIAELTREFIGEGQLFYWYRLYDRLESSYSASFVNNSSDLMYPYPTSETSYGHIQEK